MHAHADAASLTGGTWPRNEREQFCITIKRTTNDVFSVSDRDTGWVLVSGFRDVTLSQHSFMNPFVSSPYCVKLVQIHEGKGSES